MTYLQFLAAIDFDPLDEPSGGEISTEYLQIPLFYLKEYIRVARANGHIFSDLENGKFWYHGKDKMHSFPPLPKKAETP